MAEGELDSSASLLTNSDVFGFLSDGCDLVTMLAESKDSAYQCWGGLLSGSPSSCTHGFTPPPNANHFKNKFCQQCKSKGIAVSRDRIRALPPSQTTVTNARGIGLWSITEDLSTKL